MEQEREYLNILITSLKKKGSILRELLAKTEEQKALLSDEEFSETSFLRLTEEKTVLLDNLKLQDAGFESFYKKVAPILRDKKPLYQEEIRTMQKLIREITDLSVAVQSLESRNRAGLEAFVRNKRGQLRQAKRSKSAAAKYYNAMNKMNLVDPQFMDKKK
jgi:flagellar biosynthesis/type III secretory pathway chaperone